MQSDSTIYVYGWKNNEVRATLFGRRCEVVKRMKRNSAAIRMCDTGEIVITSRYALRPVRIIDPPEAKP